MIFKELEPLASAVGKIKDILEEKGLEAEIVSICDSYDRVLAEDICASENVPGFRRTAMDGYALKCGDVKGASPDNPVKLRMIGEVTMGNAPCFTIEEGTCAFVPTGGMVPDGADGMVIIEDTASGGDIPDGNDGEIYIGMLNEAVPGEHFVDEDEDVSAGEKVLSRGLRLKAQDVGVLAALGRENVKVYRPLKMAVISTGDELLGPGEKAVPGKVRDINSYTMMATAKKYGMEISEMLLLKDDEQLIEDSIKKAMEKADIIACSGGSSVGKKDFTAEIINKVADPGVFVHGIALKPGKPIIAGYDKSTKTLFIGVPGHPASAIMSFELVAAPAIRQLQEGSAAKENEITIPAVLEAPASAKKTRDTCVTVKLEKTGSEGEVKAVPTGKKSGAITMLSSADGYILIPAGRKYEKGDKVQIHLF